MVHAAPTSGSQAVSGSRPTLTKLALRTPYADLALMRDVRRDRGLGWTVVLPPRLADSRTVTGGRDGAIWLAALASGLLAGGIGRRRHAAVGQAQDAVAAGHDRRVVGGDHDRGARSAVARRSASAWSRLASSSSAVGSSTSSRSAPPASARLDRVEQDGSVPDLHQRSGAGGQHL
jgi:hypothetical protein